MNLQPDDFARLYRRHAQSLLVFFQRRVHDAELATDLMSDTFATALDRHEQFRGDSDAELSGWLWSIARSTLRDYERRGATERAGARRLGVERRALTDREIERIEEIAGMTQLRELITGVLAELPSDQRVAVQLRVLEELPYKEVAARMGMPVPLVRTHVSRGLRRLSRGLREAEMNLEQR
ncbi:sigma-70 family RNA polymerase sigma factor [Conexibacter stalactiti]|uniref:Sigma-70 family RNA polymerase sigma factor n=1 Tax=Conexibacter stalactiti TaxID=1940611 RepID=A0ABU4HTT1_9ACTN|nr:sigma-70 family RNA polymerase sigma factor [Conexibacter stalactiti]MDW5596077.1 sigma-70 family RNA polymerase sigma factor [Conexibacter stalactiti]MEC5036719.1 sigma-70 family RNA polymerase sigma factor [Conexibacter stalactiti]